MVRGGRDFVVIGGGGLFRAGRLQGNFHLEAGGKHLRISWEHTERSDTVGQKRKKDALKS